MSKKKLREALISAFNDMEEEEKSIKKFDNITVIILPSGGFRGCMFAEIILQKTKGGNFIKILYGKNGFHEIIKFNTIEEQKDAVIWLKENDILPQKDDVIKALSPITGFSIAH